MGDAIKWGLLAVGIIAIIALIMALPFTGFMSISDLSTQLGYFVNTLSEYAQFARGLVNNFTSAYGRLIITGIFGYLLAKWAYLLAFKLVVWIYHWIFK